MDFISFCFTGLFFADARFEDRVGVLEKVFSSSFRKDSVDYLILHLFPLRSVFYFA